MLIYCDAAAGRELVKHAASYYKQVLIAADRVALVRPDGRRSGGDA